MRRFLAPLAVALVVVGAACGGTDWNSTQVSSTGAPTHAHTAKSAAAAAAARRAALAEATAERPFLDAMVASGNASAKADPTNDPGPAVIKCIATAIVHGYGAAAFTNAGITATALRAPDSDLDALPAPTDAQIDAIGSALQKCSFLKEVAAPLAESLKFPDAATIACFTKQLATPDARRFLVLSGLGRDIDLLTAHSLVDVISACIDLPTMVLRAGNVIVDQTTRTCLLDTLQGSQDALKDYIALQISGADPTTAETSYETVTTSMNQCRPSARTGFTIPSG